MIYQISFYILAYQLTCVTAYFVLKCLDTANTRTELLLIMAATWPVCLPARLFYVIRDKLSDDDSSPKFRIID
jgi:prolipoprotein diacylglyceryltransferase